MNYESKIIIIDNFYKNPMAVRDFALSMEFENESTPNYPGYQSILPAISQHAINKFESILNATIDLDKCKNLMGYFRYITQTGKSRLHVHTDLFDWTAVIYLSPNDKIRLFII